MIIYAGRRYRLADDENKARQQFGDEAVDYLTDEAAKLLQQYGIEVADPEIFQEADGVDLIYNLPISNIPKSTILLDSNIQDRTIQEVVVDICGTGYVATGEKQLEPLLQAIGVLQQLHAAGKPNRQNKRQIQAREWLEYYLPQLLVELERFYKESDLSEKIDPYEQDMLVEHFVRVLKAPAGDKAFRNRANAQQAIKFIPLLDADDYKALIDNLLKTRGKAYPLRELVDAKITELTAHEDYSGDIQIMGYDGDHVAVAVEVPPPFEGMLFVLRFPAGSRNAELVSSGMVLCGGRPLIAGDDEEMAKRMVSAMIELVLASDRAANPDISQPPEEAEEEDASEWSDKEIKKYMDEGMVFFESGDDYRYRYKSLGNLQSSCLKKEKYDEGWNSGQFAKTMGIYGIERAFLVDQEGLLFLLDPQTGKKKVRVRRVELPEGMKECSF